MLKMNLTKGKLPVVDKGSVLAVQPRIMEHTLPALNREAVELPSHLLTLLQRSFAHGDAAAL